MKSVFILRGVPGNGKSTLANKFCLMDNQAIVCEADAYFMKNGEYIYNRDEIHLAHQYCFDMFKSAMKQEVETIIVSNTNTTEKEVNKYRTAAIAANYTVFVITVENWHKGSDVHNVPDDVKDRMRNNLMNSIKL